MCTSTYISIRMLCLYTYYVYVHTHAMSIYILHMLLCLYRYCVCPYMACTNYVHNISCPNINLYAHMHVMYMSIYGMYVLFLYT